MTSTVEAITAERGALEWGEFAADCITAYAKAGLEYAALCGREMDLEADRPAKKLDAILRIKATENVLNPERPHSASSAEAVVETDHEYRAYLKLQSDGVVMKNQARCLMESARLRSELAIARFKVQGGLT